MSKITLTTGTARSLAKLASDVCDQLAVVVDTDGLHTDEAEQRTLLALDKSEALETLLRSLLDQEAT